MGKQLMPQFQEAFAALNRANVVLYPVDLAAFTGDRLWSVWDTPCMQTLSSPSPIFRTLGPINYGPGPVLGTPGSPAINSYGLSPFANAPTFRTACSSDPSAGPLDRIGEEVVAKSTGGGPCDAGNHVEHCIEKAEAESNGYYLLGFYVPQQSRKEGWHELRVQVSGDHGPVRTRSGYYLEAQRPAPTEQDTHAIDDAIVAALEYTGIVFNVEPHKRNGTDGTVSFKLSISGSSIMTLPGQDKLSFDIVSVPISAHGIPIPGAGRITKVDIDRAAIEKALAHGWKLIDQANSPRTAIAVKVVVRDNVNGRIGSVVFPLAEYKATVN
jgi:hypothetical protein